MGDPRWTEETERIVANAMLAELYRQDNNSNERDVGWQVARAALAALSSEGLLVAPGGEVHEEWRVAGYSLRTGKFVAVVAFPGSVKEAVSETNSAGWDALGYDAKAEVSVVTTWPDGSQHRGAWREVNGD